MQARQAVEQRRLPLSHRQRPLAAAAAPSALSADFELEMMQIFVNHIMCFPPLPSLKITYITSQYSQNLSAYIGQTWAA